MVESRIDYLRIKYDRELFILNDGGTLALDWYDGIPKANTSDTDDQRPILVCISGLGGSTQAPYIKNVVNEMNRDFKCVFIQWRAAGDVPVTSSKLYCMGAWKDLKEPIDYINQKYCNRTGLSPLSKAPSRPMYMFACSLGAICANLYLINDAN